MSLDHSLASASDTPKSVGPCRILSEIARGGQGVVYEAKHENMERTIALKLLLDDSDRARKRFQQEARVLARLEHPNLPRVTDLGEADGKPYLAMKLVEGEDLRSILEHRGVQAWSWTAGVVASVARTLHYCHEQGVVHRDMKPDNVVMERNRPVLIDFGLLKPDMRAVGELSLEDLSRLSMSGEIRGTPSYMAPEQADSNLGEVGPWSDVYALGGTLFCLLTGSPPFQSTSTFALLIQLVDEDPPDSREIDPKIPPALAELCLACLAKDPTQRPSALALAEGLAAFRASAVAQARSEGGRAYRAWSLALALGAAVLAGAALLWPKPNGEGPTPARPETPNPIVRPTPEASPEVNRLLRALESFGSQDPAQRREAAAEIASFTGLEDLATHPLVTERARVEVLFREEFEGGMLGWLQKTDGVDPKTQVARGGDSGSWQRTESGEKSRWISFSKPLRGDVERCDHLVVGGRVRVDLQTLPNSGWWSERRDRDEGGEYPATLLVEYRDATERPLTWVHGFLYEHDGKTKLTNYTRVQRGEWTRFGFDLQDPATLAPVHPAWPRTLTRPAALTQIAIRGAGRDYKGSVDDLTVVSITRR